MPGKENMIQREYIILTYPTLSQYETRPLECPICRVYTNTYVTANSVLTKAPLYCKNCERFFETDFDGVKRTQKSLI